MRIGTSERLRVKQQISMKSALVELWIRTAIPWQRGADGELLRDNKGELLLDFYPRGPTDFAKWDATLHSVGNRDCTFTAKDETGNEYSVSLSGLAKFSRTNLGQHYHLDDVDKALKQVTLLASRAKVQLEKSQKVSIIENQELEISHLKRVIKEQERECREARTEARKAKAELASNRQESANNESEQKRNIAALEKKISSLTRDLSKVSPISAAKGK